MEVAKLATAKHGMRHLGLLGQRRLIATVHGKLSPSVGINFV